MASESNMYVTRMIKTGRAEFPVNFFWKTFDNGLETIRAKTTRDVTMIEIITFELSDTGGEHGQDLLKAQAWHRARRRVVIGEIAEALGDGLSLLTVAIFMLLFEFPPLL